jgi:diguanylate cyclase
MDPTAPPSIPSPVDVARAALRSLAQRRLEPTPDNYARAWAEQAGAGPQAPVQQAAQAGTDGLRVVAALSQVCAAALAAEDERASGLAARWRVLAQELAQPEPPALPVAQVEALCAEAASWLGHRHLVVAELLALCRQMSGSLVELAEDDSWTQGQCAALQASLGSGPSLLALRAAGQMLDRTRAQQARLRDERSAARDALRQLLARMMDEVGALGAHAGVFELAVERHAEVVAGADSVESLAAVVQSMLEDSREVGRAVSGARQRMQEQQARAHELEDRVRALEAELRELSDQVVTDTLTQVANRRGLEQAFAIEVARSRRATGSAAALAVAVIDVDHFKQLNDRLGHLAGDHTLRSLASAIRTRLRPVDHVARYGGEEFVVLLPGTPVQAAQQALVRLQRSLSEALFMHEGEDVFVTFSAGVTLWRDGESLEATLSRADEALYEAKRTGRNRTCVG